MATSSYGFVYPLLLSPAYAVFDSLPHAYAAAKAINAALMSSAAIPAYLIARRVLRRPLALLAAVMAVAIPPLAYVNELMTENAFYPLFLWTVLALLAALERPTRLSQLGALVLLGALFLTRVQAIAVLAAYPLAVVLFALLDTRAQDGRASLAGVGRRLLAFRLSWIVGLGAAAALAAVQLVRDRSPVELLGAYRAAAAQDYGVRDVAEFLLYHLADLDLALGFLPLAASFVVVALALRRDEPDRRLRAFTAVSMPLVASMTLLVAAFATQPSVQWIEERNLFYVTPLFLIALLVWIERGLPRPALVAGAGALVAGLLAWTLPYERFINPKSIADAPSLLSLWSLGDRFDAGPQIPTIVLVAGLIAAALFLTLPRRLALVAPALLIAYYALSYDSVLERQRNLSVGSLYSGIRVEREWIDEAVGSDEVIAVVSGQFERRLVLWENEFFNRSLGPVYYLEQPLPGTLPERRLSVEESTGQLHDEQGRAVYAHLALADGTVELAGERVAEDPGTGVALFRVDGPLFSLAEIDGLYPSDTWSGPQVDYVRRQCEGGRLTVSLTSGPDLFDRPQRVVVESGGRVVARASVAPDAVGRLLTVPLASDGGRCEARFTVSPTQIPDELDGKGDTRPLGLHFNHFRYRPPAPGGER